MGIGIHGVLFHDSCQPFRIQGKWWSILAIPIEDNPGGNNLDRIHHLYRYMFSWRDTSVEPPRGLRFHLPCRIFRFLEIKE
jgi:hypothetical protein